MKTYTKMNKQAETSQKEPKTIKLTSIYKVKESNIKKMNEYLNKQK